MDDRAEIMAWRRAERTRLLEARLRMPVADKQQASVRIIENLTRYCREARLPQAGTVVSGYWPLRGEPDVRPWLAQVHEAGWRTVLPVVAEKGKPLVFRRWAPGCAMEKGFWNIPVPADTTEFTPRLLLAPVVGFDAKGYRLGYGGGYFDRTLALLRALQVEFHAIGVGYAEAQLPTIHPLPHDIALNTVITEASR
jgi:5,10-methenyltetrahydrofolate synthetase